MAPQRIKEIWAFLARDQNQMEGICGFYTPDGWLPMVCGDKTRADVLRKIARKIARETGHEVTLARFQVRVDTEIFNSLGSNAN